MVLLLACCLRLCWNSLEMLHLQSLVTAELLVSRDIHWDKNPHQLHQRIRRNIKANKCNNLWLLKIALEVIFLENIEIIILENETKIVQIINCCSFKIKDIIISSVSSRSSSLRRQLNGNCSSPIDWRKKIDKILFYSRIFDLRSERPSQIPGKYLIYIPISLRYFPMHAAQTEVLR